jgi:hypothetical protein
MRTACPVERPTGHAARDLPERPTRSASLFPTRKDFAEKWVQGVGPAGRYNAIHDRQRRVRAGHGYVAG